MNRLVSQDAGFRLATCILNPSIDLLLLTINYLQDGMPQDVDHLSFRVQAKTPVLRICTGRKQKDSGYENGNPGADSKEREHLREGPFFVSLQKDQERELPI